MLEPNLIESEAFESLSGKAALVCLIRFYQKAYRPSQRRKKRGKQWLREVTNQGQIIFTYAEANEIGVGRRTYYNVIRELVGKGFIDIAEQGNWYQQKPSRYSISWRWEAYGTQRFKEAEIPRALPHGLGFQPGNVNGRKGEA
jgi:hypothetical protein